MGKRGPAKGSTWKQGPREPSDEAWLYFELLGEMEQFEIAAACGVKRQAVHKTLKLWAERGFFDLEQRRELEKATLE